WTNTQYRQLQRSNTQQDNQLSPASSKTQENQLSPAWSNTQDNQLSPASSNTHDNQLSPASSNTQDNQLSPAWSKTQDNQLSPASSKTQDNQLSPASSNTQDNQLSPASSKTQDNQLSPAWSKTQENQLSPASSNTQDNQLSPAWSNTQYRQLPLVQVPRHSENSLHHRAQNTRRNLHPRAWIPAPYTHNNNRTHTQNNNRTHTQNNNRTHTQNNNNHRGYLQAISRVTSNRRDERVGKQWIIPRAFITGAKGTQWNTRRRTRPRGGSNITRPSCQNGKVWRRGACVCPYLSNWEEESQRCTCIYGTYADTQGNCRSY
ncbi:putative beta-3 adrenergic receptor-like, partial [Homarus americanus]